MKDRHYVGVIGIVVTIIGWVILSGDHFPFVYRMLAPQYMDSLTAIERMQQQNHLLKKGDIGFSEISGMIKTLMAKDPAQEMVQIKTLAFGRGSIDGPEGTKLVDRMRLEVLFSDSLAEVWEVGGLKTAIKKKYLNLDIFLWGSVIFGVGIVLSLISVLIKE
ncbi:MAG: hypothetical protein PVG99_11895 [Desulfobacteraceae bacterium]